MVPNALNPEFVFFETSPRIEPPACARLVSRVLYPTPNLLQMSTDVVAASTTPVNAAGNVNLKVLITSGKNPRGIPAAIFIEKLEDFLVDGISVESALGAFNELYSKYKYMETQFEKSKGVYKSKLPEIEQTLELIRAMVHKSEEGEDYITNYNLCDTIYAKAKVDISAGVVYLWIGASTMVEYTYEEAINLLETQLEQTHFKINELQEDLYYIRGNAITVEVNMARLFNHSVKLKKTKENAAAAVAAIAVMNQSQESAAAK